jgi:hypothetical protein
VCRTWHSRGGSQRSTTIGSSTPSRTGPMREPAEGLDPAADAATLARRRPHGGRQHPGRLPSQSVAAARCPPPARPRRPTAPARRGHGSS